MEKAVKGNWLVGHTTMYGNYTNALTIMFSKKGENDEFPTIFSDKSFIGLFWEITPGNA